jgi:CrcB protein
VFKATAFMALGRDRPTASARDKDHVAEGIISGAAQYFATVMGGLNTWFAVAAGGALGSLARFWLAGWVTALTGPRFPWGTLLINILGSFVIGAVAGVTLNPARVTLHPDIRIFLMVGVCGGFTTFSAFSLQMLELLQTGYVAAGLLYAAGSVLLCLLFVWFGWSLGRL